MSSRKAGYLLSLFLLVVCCSAPHLFLLFKFTSDAVVLRRLPFQLNQSWGRVTQQGGAMTYSAFAESRFLYLMFRERVNDLYMYELISVDPRTRVETPTRIQVRGITGSQLLTFGSRLWIVGSLEAFEVVDGEARPSTMVNPIPWVAEPQRFLLDGEPAIVVRSGPRLAISAFKSGAWAVSHNLVLPNNGGRTVIDGVSINFANASALNATCINQGERIHLFLEVDGWLLYREGLELQSVIGPEVKTVGLLDEAASVPRNGSTGRSRGEWMIVNKTPVADVGNNFAFRYRATGNKFAMVVDGQPAAVLIDGSDPGTMIGHLFRFDGGVWSEFATQTYPFGTASIRVAHDDDGKDAFIVATTSTGVVNAYEVDASGVSATPGNRAVAVQAFTSSNAIVDATGMLVVATILAGLLGIGTMILMHRYTGADYVSGARCSKLAGLGRRGLARVIDLTLIGLSTAIFAMWLTRDLDWLSLTEALNLQLPHPTLQAAKRSVWMLVLWLAVCEVLLVMMQACWGLTIGKWCCGLRTQQTTLRPCGFARSMVRELVFYVDVCCFLCWTPGILSIALTDRRQRLGDLVADTVVIDISKHRSAAFDSPVPVSP